MLSEAPPTLSSTAPSGGSCNPADLPLERVEVELCTLAGQIAAATSRFLVLLADFDARDGWAGWGVVSCAHWLSWRCGLDLRTAHEHVRVARALRELPQLSAAFAHGRVSYSKVRAVCRVATPDNEQDLLDAALHAPAAHLERLVRGLRTAGSGSDGSSGEQPPRMRWRWDDDGQLVVWGRMRAEDGARLLAGLSRIDQQRRTTDATDAAACGQPRSAEHPPAAATPARPGVAGDAPADLGPALVAAAEALCCTIEAPIHAPAADVVVHVDADTLVETARRTQANPKNARLDGGPALLHATLQMLACDGRIQLSVGAADGRTLNLGRKRRRANRHQLAALWRRDRGCAAPGCDHTRFLHAHHVVFWATGGRTDIDNLLLLCGDHHRLLHDGGFSIVALGKQRFRFHGPQGTVRPQAPRMCGDATELTSAHPDLTPDTIEPDWDGTPLHLHEAVNTYLTAWANTAAAAHTASGPSAN